MSCGGFIVKGSTEFYIHCSVHRVLDLTNIVARTVHTRSKCTAKSEILRVRGSIFCVCVPMRCVTQFSLLRNYFWGFLGGILTLSCFLICVGVTHMLHRELVISGWASEIVL